MTQGLKIIFILLLIFAQSAKAYSGEEKKYSWFWFFYEKEHSSNYSSVVYRPFYLENNKGNRTFEASLMPFGYWRYITPRTDDTKGFLGFYESVNFIHGNGSEDYDFGMFPLLYYGTARNEKEKYLLVWPVGGSIKGKFAHEKISAWAFPGFLLFFIFPPPAFFSIQTGVFVFLSMFPMYAEFHDRDYHAWSLIWPLVMRGKSGTRDEVRVLPFYSRFTKKGWRDSRTWLLLFSYSETYFKNDTHYSFFFFPVFGKKWSDSGDFTGTTVLWPFFSWGEDKKKKETTYNLPWPLVMIQDSEKPKIYKRIFFPFYGKYIYDTSETLFITPFYFTMEKKGTRFDSDYKFYFILYWNFKREYHQKPDPYYGNSWRYYKLWPLFQYEKNDMGDMSINVLSLLPFRDTEGYEKMYQPFWTLFEYRKFRSGEKRLGLLLRTYFQRWGDGFFFSRIPLIFGYESRDGRVREFSMILSMFGYEHNERGKYLRLFWAPLKIGEPEPWPADYICEEKDPEDGNELYYVKQMNQHEIFLSNNINVTERF